LTEYRESRINDTFQIKEQERLVTKRDPSDKKIVVSLQEGRETNSDEAGEKARRSVCLKVLHV
jgi:hypothetical protein